MPGLLDSDVATIGEGFDAGEIAGMRSAAWILLATAGLSVLIWVVRRAGFFPVASLIDVFLGVQLLGLKHTWRAWVLVRAGVGAAVGVVVALSALSMHAGSVLTSMYGWAQLTYCGSLFLLLLGHPSTRRVLAGRLVFAVSMILTAGAVAWTLSILARVNA